AKLIDRTDLTQTQDVIGTPAYMAPEQASGARDQLGPATDIFSLGILFYELLTGLVPFRADSAVETLRLITEHEPIAPRVLQPNVPRDLDTICMKCLAKQPHERYTTAEELAGDLRRYRNNEPILAKPPGPIARAWKWSRRHPGLASAVGIGAIAAAILLFIWARFTTEVTALNRDLVATNAALEEEKEEATRQGNAATAIRTFLTNELLAQAAPEERARSLRKQGKDSETFDRDPTISTVLKEVVASLDGNGLEERFPQQPDAQKHVLLVLGHLLEETGDEAGALRLYERGLTGASDDSPTEWELAIWNVLALQWSFSGRTDEAIERFKWLASKYEELGKLNPQAAALHNLAGTMMMSRGDTGVALGHVNEAIKISTEVDGVEDIQTLVMQGTKAGLLRVAGKLAESITLLETTLADMNRTLGPKHPRAIYMREKLAQGYLAADRTDDATRMMQSAVDLATEVLGEDHPKTASYRKQLDKIPVN
ncbi:MAG: serine/threonine-protein kinase, partial [Planctomycetota bacterium]